MRPTKKRAKRVYPSVLIQVPVTFTGVVPVILEKCAPMKRLNKLAGEIAMTKVQMHSSLKSVTAKGKWSTIKKFTA